MEGNSNRIPHFLKAKTPLKLQSLMLVNNSAEGVEYRYDIVHDGKHWFAWFLKDIGDDALNSLTKGATDGSK